MASNNGAAKEIVVDAGYPESFARRLHEGMTYMSLSILIVIAQLETSDECNVCISSENVYSTV